jgi:hypothetical protein
VNSQLFSERIDLRDLCTAMTPPQTLDNRQYKCNRVANSKALNSLHLLQKQVPKILKCRNVRVCRCTAEDLGSNAAVVAQVPNEALLVNV